MLFSRKPRRIYADYAATTPLHPQVIQKMRHALDFFSANPGSLYREGVEVAQKINEVRRSVASHLGTTYEHIIFTRGGTESNNIALEGVIHGYQGSGVPHVITSAIEHSAVRDTLLKYEALKIITLTLLPVTRQGSIVLDDLKKALRPETILVSLMYVNNEIGSILPLRESAKVIRWYKKHHSEETSSYPLLHTDAIQAVGSLDLHVDRLGVDLMSISGSKIYGPKSSGVLYIRDRKLLAPFFSGGDQEFGLRAGTEDVVQIVGFGEALSQVRDSYLVEYDRLRKLQVWLIHTLRNAFSDIILHGADPTTESDERSAHNINLTVPGISGERLVIELDARGICVASKSACHENEDGLSHVIRALYHDDPAQLPLKEGTLRITLGRYTTQAEVARIATELIDCITSIRTFEKNLPIPLDTLSHSS